MINANIANAVSEALEAHWLKARSGERLADTVARTSEVSDAQAEQIYLDYINRVHSADNGRRRDVA